LIPVLSPANTCSQNWSFEEGSGGYMKKFHFYMESLTSESHCPKGVAFIIHDAFHFVACVLDLSDL
jgi:hypothetical protein